jgi:hypothetical protein
VVKGCSSRASHLLSLGTSYVSYPPVPFGLLRVLPRENPMDADEIWAKPMHVNYK